MFDKEQNRKIKTLLELYDKAESDTVWEASTENLNSLAETINTKRSENTVKIKVKSLLLIAAAVIIAVCAISVVMIAQGRNTITLQNDRSSGNLEVNRDNIDLTQIDFRALSVPEGYTEIVIWEQLGLWGTDFDTYPKDISILAEGVFEDTQISIEENVEYKTKKINGVTTYYKTYIEDIEFDDRTERWAYVHYHFLNGVYYIYVEHMIQVPLECEDPYGYVENARIPDEEIFTMIAEVDDQIREINGIKKPNWFQSLFS